MWSENGFPAWSLEKAHGTPLKVDGLPGKLSETNGRCGSLGADRQMLLAVQRPDIPDNWYGLRACIRGPDSASTAAAIRDLINSTKFANVNGRGNNANAAAPGPVVRNGALAGQLIVKPAVVSGGERIGVAVRNLGKETLGYGLELHVEHWSGGKWRSAKTAVYGPGVVGIRAVGFTVPPGHTSGPGHDTRATFDGVTLPPKLEPGRYRFLKRASRGLKADGPHIELVAGFRVRSFPEKRKRG